MRALFWLLALGLLLTPPARADDIELNQASEAQLDSLLHVGPALSQRMLGQRQQAPFADWADLIRRVPGIGPRRARQLSAQGLRIEGRAYPERAEAAPEGAPRPPAGRAPPPSRTQAEGASAGP